MVENLDRLVYGLEKIREKNVTNLYEAGNRSAYFRAISFVVTVEARLRRTTRFRFFISREMIAISRFGFENLDLCSEPVV